MEKIYPQRSFRPYKDAAENILFVLFETGPMSGKLRKDGVLSEKDVSNPITPKGKAVNDALCQAYWAGMEMGYRLGKGENINSLVREKYSEVKT